MTLPELLCYLLNYRGKNMNAEKKRRLNKIDQNFGEFYKSEVCKNDRIAMIYIEQSGTFLNRFKNSISFFRKNFDKDFFKDKVVLVIGSGRGADVLTLSKYEKAKFIYGIDVSPELTSFSKRMLNDHKVSDTEIICADMSSVPEISNNSIDVIVSIATFEHIIDLKSVLEESYRVMKVGAVLHASFSPIWRHYYGSHLSKELPFPWTHLIFDEPTVRRTLERLQGIPRRAVLYSGLNKLTLSDYNRIIRSTPFSEYKMYQTTSSSIKKVVKSIPVINEYIYGSVVVVLKK